MPKIEMVTESGCWIWMGSLNPYNGYARLGVMGRNWIAHVVTYELYIGSVPEGLELDHKCRVRCCVNPWHLEPVTHTENMRRGKIAERRKTKTHCPHGHSYDETNSYFYNGSRQCIACRRSRALESYRSATR